MRKKLGFFIPTILLAIICYLIEKNAKIPVNWNAFPLFWFLNVMLYLPFADTNDPK